MGFIKRIEKAIIHANEKIDTLEKNTELLNKMLTEQAETIKFLLDEIKKSNEKKEKTQEKIAAIYDNSFKIKNEVHSNHNDINKVRTEVHEAHENINKVRTEVHEAHENINKVRTEVHEAHGNINRVRTEVHESYENINKVRVELHNTYLEVQKLRENVGEKKNYINNEIVEKLIRENMPIIIAGTGNVRKLVMEYLYVKGANIYCVASEGKEESLLFLYGKPVMELKQAIKLEKQAVVLIAEFEQSQKKSCELMKQYEINNYLCMRDYLFREWKEEVLQTESVAVKNTNYLTRYIHPYTETLEEVLGKEEKSLEETREYIANVLNEWDATQLYLPRIVVVLGTKCSLRCKECNNLMPHFKPQMDLDVNKIIRSLEILASKCHSVLRCELIGGEPFLSKNLEKVLAYALQQPKFRTVEITSNGTIMPDIDMNYLLQNEKVIIRISDYGNLVDKNKMIQHLQQNNIKYEVLDLGNWVSPGGVEKRNKSEYELRKNYKACGPGYFCKALYDGKLFSCARAASLYALGYMVESEYVEIEPNTEKEEIIDFLLKDYSIACDYCDMANEKKVYVEPAVQI